MAASKSIGNLYASLGLSTGPFTKSVEDAKKGFRDLSDSAASSGTGMGNLQGGVANLAGGFTSLVPAIAGVTAVLGGGAAFAGSVSAFLDLASGVKQLETRFGMSAEAASQMSTQLKLVGISTDDYTSMAFKLDKQVKSNEAGLNAMGVATRDSNGHLLNQKTLMENATTSMMSYAAGTDRNEAAMRLFGKSGDDAMSLMKLNEATLQRAAVLTDAYGLALNDVSLQKAKDYKIAMNEVKLAGESVASHLGEAMVPTLTTLAQTFTDIAVDVVPSLNNGFELAGTVFSGVADIFKYGVDAVRQIFNSLAGIVSSAFGSDMPADFFTWSTAMKVSGTAVTVIVSGMKVAIDTLVFAVQSAGIGISVLSSAAGAAISGDWDKVTSIVQKGFSDVQAFQSTYSAKMAANATSVEASLTKIWMSNDKVSESNKNHGKTLDDLSGKQKAATGATDDGTAAYNRQVDAFNALIDENTRVDAAMAKVSASTLTVQQATDNLTAADKALAEVRAQSHTLIMQGVQDGVDYVAIKKQEEAAEKLDHQAKSDLNKVKEASIKFEEDLNKAIAANIIQSGILVPNIMSVKDAQAAYNATLQAGHELAVSGLADGISEKANKEQQVIAANNLKAAQDNLKLSTQNVSTAVTDVQAAYVAWGGTANPAVTALATDIGKMNGSLGSTLAVLGDVSKAFGGAFGDTVSKIISVLNALNSVNNALDGMSTLANSAGQALGLISGSGSSSGGVGGIGSVVGALGSAGGSVLGGIGSVVGALGSAGSSVLDGIGSVVGAIAPVALPLLLAGGVIYGVSSLLGGGHSDELTGNLDRRTQNEYNKIVEMANAGNSEALAVLQATGGTYSGWRNATGSSLSGIVPDSVVGSGNIADTDYTGDMGLKLVNYIASHDTVASAVSGQATGPELSGFTGFAAGGAFGGGLRLVGEHGPELEVTGPSRIYSNSDTTAMLDNSKIVTALQDLKEILWTLINIEGDQKVVGDKMYNILDRVTQGGTRLRIYAA